MIINSIKKKKKLKMVGDHDEGRIVLSKEEASVVQLAFLRTRSKDLFFYSGLGQRAIGG